MRKLILIVIILFMSVAVKAATINFGNAEYATGYLVYYSDGTDVWSNDVGDRHSIDLAEFNLTPGEWTFWVVAYNSIGEGPASEIVDWSIAAYEPDANPKPITIIIPGPVTITINGD